mmetsp:Transcript_1950/g.4959  ORF Transcript_1950/g.4959 Transcript_1950/m.4959 type:complete len:207 (+) Transcript_1950:74-694(+)
MVEIDASLFTYDFESEEEQDDEDERSAQVNTRRRCSKADNASASAPPVITSAIGAAPPTHDDGKDARREERHSPLIDTVPSRPVPAPSYTVGGTKKGGFPVRVESRGPGKKVTIISNVNGNVESFLRDLKEALGTGGVAHGPNVEVQGDHITRVSAWLARAGCISGISAANKSAALPQSKSQAKQARSIKALDQKAAAIKAGRRKR